LVTMPGARRRPGHARRRCVALAEGSTTRRWCGRPTRTPRSIQRPVWRSVRVSSSANQRDHRLPPAEPPRHHKRDHRGRACPTTAPTPSTCTDAAHLPCSSPKTTGQACRNNGSGCLGGRCPHRPRPANVAGAAARPAPCTWPHPRAGAEMHRPVPMLTTSSSRLIAKSPTGCACSWPSTTSAPARRAVRAEYRVTAF
jgi:hypothetical protein